MAVTVGANLTPHKSPLAGDLRHAMHQLLRFMATGLSKTVLDSVNAVKFFTKAGAPVTNTSADSPGSDFCFILDITNDDLYFIGPWASASSFTATKVMD